MKKTSHKNEDDLNQKIMMASAKKLRQFFPKNEEDLTHKMKTTSPKNEDDLTQKRRRFTQKWKKTSPKNYDNLT